MNLVDMMDLKESNAWKWSTDKVSITLLENARRLRKHNTEAEEVLWHSLRNRKLNNLKFRRQQPLEGFILDFYCDAIKLGVEVDGGIHNEKEQIEYDEQRTAYLSSIGIMIIRFTNEEVLGHEKEVLKKIEEVAARRVSPSPRPSDTPLPRERGRGEGDLKFFQFKHLLLQNSWLTEVFVGVDGNGIIQYLSEEKPQTAIAIEYVDGYALPGFQNAHSHAFQYAMAGLAESHAPNTHDDFWTWREAMYQCALSVDPDQAEAIAAMLYSEMLRHGYTHVAEFHYLHHDKYGKPYNNLAEMGERMVSAAKTAGIKITLVPVFYQKGGFGKEPQPRQRRFISKTTEDYFTLLDDTAHGLKHYQHASLGFSVHSLRAVEPADIIQTFNEGPKRIPFHLHVAEQKKEIEDSLAYLHKRPVEWLTENLPVDERFFLVHATHLSDNELLKLAASKATVVLCPSTEGNLGDGIFRMKEYTKANGNWCIGTDSHIGLNPLEEFRMIDYRQRLITNQRNTFEGDGAAYLVDAEIKNGRAAMGVQSKNYFAVGQPLDAVVYDSKSPLLATASLKNILSTIVYTADASMTMGTLVNGEWVVKNNQHHASAEIRNAFVKTMKTLGNR